MKFIRYILLLALVAVGLFSVLQTRATCSPADTGSTGSDTIVCDVNNQPSGDVEGGAGDDNIIIEEGVTTSSQVAGDYTGSGTPGTGNDLIIIDGSLTDTSLSGDSLYDGGSGGDTIINNGDSDIEMVGDTIYGDGSGNDIIINNGTAYAIIGDAAIGNGSGSDTLINNGTVINIVGDTYDGNASGNDSITNNGYVSGNVYGDGSFVTGTGNDTIDNAGVLDGNIYGDEDPNASLPSAPQPGDPVPGSGSDTIINSGAVNGSIIAGGGDDTVIIAGIGAVNGVIDGGSGYDVLTFNLSTSNPEELQALAAQIAAANPAGGTISLQGRVYTWQNFEELSQILLSLARINDYGDPFAAFCSLGGGLDIYVTSGNQGFLALRVSVQQISNGIAYARENGVTLQIARSPTAILYVLATGELQVNAPNGADFTFSYETRCGELPEPQPIIVVTPEPDTFTIINRPR